MADKSSLRYVQFYTSELLELGAQLDGEQFKTLLLAIAHYAADGAEPDLPKDLALVFCVYRVRVDAQNDKYDRKIAAQAANGAKGGRPKKERDKPTGTAATKAVAGFKPPSIAEFRDAAEGNLDAEELNDLYKQLKADGWSIDGEPFKQKSDALMVVNMRSSPFYHKYPEFQVVFRYIFATYSGLRGDDGYSRTLYATEDMFELFREEYDCFYINGTAYPMSEWKTAAALFAEKYL